MSNQKTVLTEHLKFDDSEIKICSAFDVESALLLDFYKKAFPYRFESLQLDWQWLNRTDFLGNKAPLVMVYKNQVIAHSGIIPFNLQKQNELYKAAWYIDFKLLPQFQRHGLGSTLSKESMKLTEINLAMFCNEKSINLFKKAGWLESFETYLHLNLALPFNHQKFNRYLPSFARKALNYISYPAFLLIYRKHAYADNLFRFEKLNETSFDSFFNLYTKSIKNSENLISPKRDLEYAKWRILNSPNRQRYYVYQLEKFSAIVLLVNHDDEDYMDVLWVSDTSDKVEIKRMISTLGVYALKNNFSYVRFYTSKKDVSNYIKKSTKSILRYPRFAYFSGNEQTFEKLKVANWNLELIDSDFEHLS